MFLPQAENCIHEQTLHALKRQSCRWMKVECTSVEYSEHFTSRTIISARRIAHERTAINKVAFKTTIAKHCGKTRRNISASKLSKDILATACCPVFHSQAITVLKLVATKAQNLGSGVFSSSSIAPTASHFQYFQRQRHNTTHAPYSAHKIFRSLFSASHHQDKTLAKATNGKGVFNSLCGNGQAKTAGLFPHLCLGTAFEAT